MKVFAAFVFGVLLGSALMWSITKLTQSDKFRYTYRVNQDIVLSSASGEVGKIPPGSTLLAREALGATVDVGWWGCVPIAFTDGIDAKIALEQSDEWNPYEGPLIRATLEEQAKSDSDPVDD